MGIVMMAICTSEFTTRFGCTSLAEKTVCLCVGEEVSNACQLIFFQALEYTFKVTFGPVEVEYTRSEIEVGIYHRGFCHKEVGWW